MILRARMRAGIALAVACSAALVAAWSCSRGTARPNVVLVVVDALRPDYLGCYSYDRPTSPVIDSLAAEGILFENAIAHAAWTKPSFSSMLTSLYPFEHGVVDWESAIPESVKTLPEILRSNGYATMGVINILGLAEPHNVTRGIDGMSLAGKTKRDAFETTEAAIAFMQTAKRPYFILIHYFDVHWPYRAFPDYVNKIRREGDPDPFTTPRTGGEDAEADHPEEDRPGDYMAVEKLRYAACIRQVDTALGDLLAFLGESGSGSGTLVIVTADHGESLGQHGWGGHGTELYDAVVRVPLVISYPAKYERAQRIRDQVRHIDLLPTILELAGVEDGGWREGASLCRLIETGARANAPGKLLPEDHALCENSLRRSPFSKCIRSDAWKLMIEPATGVTSLFDLKSDPGEINDLAGTGLPAETALAEMMARVPGRSLNGWRVALVGETPEESLDVRVRPVGGRVTNVNIVSGGNDLKIMAGEDSTSLTVRTQSRGLRLVVFETVPAGVAVDVEAAAGGGRSPGALLAGETGTHPLSRKIALTQDEALGLPRAFQHLRKSRTPAICLWWMAGEQMRRPAAAAPMSIEDKKRLKALGYLQ